MRQNARVPMEAASAITARQQRWIQRTRRPLDLLAIVFLVDFLLLWSFPDADGAFKTALDVVAWLVWAGFAVDYLVRLALSASKRGFVRTHKVDLCMVLLPMLRLLRVFLLLRRSLTAVSTEKIAGSIVSIVVFVVIASAFLEWRVEYDAPGATITTFRAALWWAVVTTTTVGYGDYTPVTAPGRAIAAFVMIVGIGLIGTVSATVAAWFVTRPGATGGGEAGPADTADQPVSTDATSPVVGADDTQAVLLGRLDALAAEQREIRRLLERRATNT